MKMKVSGRPTRTWALVVSLGVPLSIVGASAMAISYATLIDVARVNGMPLPELFPVLVDVGTVAAMIAAAQFRLRGVPGRWLAYATFGLLSCVSIAANATHAWGAADMTVTTPWAAALLAATPPAALLAITHLVMTLIPDEKERAKLTAIREREQTELVRREKAGHAPAQGSILTSGQRPVPLSLGRQEQLESSSGSLRLVDAGPSASAARVASALQAEARERVLEHVRERGERPTGALVGDWLGGKTAKTGQRFLARLEAEGVFLDPAPAPSAVVG